MAVISTNVIFLWSAITLREVLPGSDFETLAAFGLWPDWHRTEVL
jgi:hypothetical protein